MSPKKSAIILTIIILTMVTFPVLAGTYPDAPNISQGTSDTEVNETNWNIFVDNINAIADELISMRGSSEFTANDTTPDVSSASTLFSVWQCSDEHSGETNKSVTNITSGTAGQFVLIQGTVSSSPRTILSSNANSNAGYMYLLNGNWTETAGSYILIRRNESADYWEEVFRGKDEVGSGGGGTGMPCKVATDYLTLNAAFDDLSDGEILWIADGQYEVTSTITVSKRISVVGESAYGVQIHMTSDDTLFEVTSNNTMWENLLICSEATNSSAPIASNAKPNLHFKGGLLHRVVNVTMYGGDIGIYMQGALQCTIEDFRVGASGPFGAGYSLQYGIYADRYNSRSSNGFSIKNPQITAGCEYGIYIGDQSGEGSGHITGGVVQGATSGAITIINCDQGVTISSVHNEAGGSGITITNSNNVRIVGCFVATTGGITGTGNSILTIEDSYVSSGITLNNTNDMVTIRNVAINTQEISLQATNSVIENVINYTDALYTGYSTHGAGYNKSYRNLCAGNLEVWAGGLPVGFGAQHTAAVVSQEKSIVKFGDSSAKVTRQSGSNINGIYYEMDHNRYAAPFEDGRATHTSLTVSAWIYLPASNAIESPRIVVNYPSYSDSPKSLSKVFSGVTTEEWTRITASFRLKDDVSGMRVSIGSWATDDVGDYMYVDGIEIVEGSTPSPIYDDSRDPEIDQIYLGRLINNPAIEFATADATPDVSGGNLFTTANTAGTTITDFDNSCEGHTIKVIIADDETAFDFTSNANMKGNNGRDWYPKSGDHLIATQVGTVWYCEVSNNTSDVVEFDANDATPSVKYGEVFTTANTSGTTITNFDNGQAGDRIKVIIADDNTAFDFTSNANMKGNAGRDWYPQTGDHVVCVKSGSVWYCEVSKNITDYITFSANDSTPSVKYGEVFVTANTAGTSITNFDDGQAGDRITVIVGDSNTTFDFTASSLIHPSGSDYNASSGDILYAVRGGSSWYCTINDNSHE